MLKGNLQIASSGTKFLSSLENVTVSEKIIINTGEINKYVIR